MDVVANDDELKDLGTARRDLIPKRGSGKPTSPTTVWRWIKKGILGVRLQVKYVGSTPYVSRAMINEFIEAVTAARTKKDEAKPDDVSDDELRAAGLN